MNISISVYADKSEAKLTGIYVDTNVGTDDLRWHERIMDVVESIAAELVEGIQEVNDGGNELDDPIYPEPIPGELEPVDPDDLKPIDEQPIPTPKPVNPPYEKM